MTMKWNVALACMGLVVHRETQANTRYCVRRLAWLFSSPYSDLLQNRKRKNEGGISYGQNPESQLEKHWYGLFPGSWSLLEEIAEEDWVEMRCRARMGIKGQQAGLWHRWQSLAMLFPRPCLCTERWGGKSSGGQSPVTVSVRLHLLPCLLWKRE